LSQSDNILSLLGIALVLRFFSKGKTMHLLSNARRRIKNSVIKLALWGLMPIKLADWLIQLGGLSHD
jgi:hypothetical protein